MTNEAAIKSFLLISKKDLLASNILYQNKLYCQSLFSFQQSIEKANKALALYTNYYSFAHLKKFSHSQSRLIDGIIKKHADEVKFPEPLPPEAEIIFDRYGFDYPDYLQRLQSSKEDILLIQSLTELSQLSAVRLNSILKLLRSLPSTRQLHSKKLFSAIQEGIAKFLMDNPEYLLSEDDPLDEGSRQEIIYAISVVAVNVYTLMFAVFSIHILGFLSDQLVSQVRYPEIVRGVLQDPTSLFTRKLPLIRKLPEFQDIAEKALKTIHKTILT